MTLFPDDQFFTSGMPEKTVYSFPDADIVHFENFFKKGVADQYYTRFIDEIKWEQNNITIYGKEHKVPRLTAWYGEDKSYTYSNILNRPNPWIPELLEIKACVEKEAEVIFTNVLLNLYRHGLDSVGWHRDNEKEFGEQPVIASVSFGESRIFQMRHKFRKDIKKIDIPLNHGSMLLMKGNTQEYWEHQVPKRRRSIVPRINLTFRVINI